MNDQQAEAYGPRGNASLHLPRAELDAKLSALPDAPKEIGRLLLIVNRRTDGVRETPSRVELSPSHGVPGDRWFRQTPDAPEAQLTVMRNDIAELIANGQPRTTFGDNLFVDLDISVANLPVGTRLQVGDAIVEMSSMPHNGCAKFNARFGADALRFVQDAETRDQNRRGVYWTVAKAGMVEVGDAIRVLSRC